MIYNTIKHEIRNNANLSLLDYCLLESIYLLSSSEKATYKTWCNASKSSFKYLASERTIVTRFNELEKLGWLEFKDSKRFLKRTTKKYYNEVYCYVLGVQKLHGEEVAPMQELHPTHADVAHLGVQKLHEGCAEVAPNNNIDNNKDNNIERERKEKMLSLENKVLIEQVEDLQTELFYLKTEAEKQRKVAEKESFGDLGTPSWKVEIESSANFKKWSSELKESFLEFCQHRNDLLKDAIGKTKYLTNGTAKQIFKTTLGYLKKYTELEVIECFELAIENSNTRFDPLFVKNKKLKDKQNGKQTNNNKQPIDDGLSYAERAMRERFGSDLLTDQYQNGSSDDNYQGVEQEF